MYYERTLWQSWKLLPSDDPVAKDIIRQHDNVAIARGYLHQAILT